MQQNRAEAIGKKAFLMIYNIQLHISLYTGQIQCVVDNENQISRSNDI